MPSSKIKYSSICLFREIIRFYLSIELSEEEMQLLQSYIISFYPRSSATGQVQLDRDSFLDLMLHSFSHKVLDTGNMAIAKQTALKVKISLKNRAQQSK